MKGAVFVIGILAACTYMLFFKNVTFWVAMLPAILPLVIAIVILLYIRWQEDQEQKERRRCWSQGERVEYWDNRVFKRGGES